MLLNVYILHKQNCENELQATIHARLRAGCQLKFILCNLERETPFIFKITHIPLYKTSFIPRI